MVFAFNDHVIMGNDDLTIAHKGANGGALRKWNIFQSPADHL